MLSLDQSVTKARLRRALVLLALGSGALAALPARAQAPLVVRMATLVPDGSSWHLILKETAERWRTLSGGRVTVRLFPGGVAGDDSDVVRKMRQGTLNAGLLTSLGLAEIDKSVYALGVPLMYDSYEELYYVHERMRPRLEVSLEAKGFVVLNWADAGWVRFFTQKPVAGPEDLKELKLFSWAGDAESVSVWRSAGFNPVPLPSTEIANALRTGLVNALGTPPNVAVISQLFSDAKNMTDLRWQILLGATVITRSTWDTVPADVRPALLDAARAAGSRLQREIKEGEAKDIEAMKRRGLNVVAVDAKRRAEWRKLTETIYPRIRGPIVPADAFDEAMRYRDEYRQRGRRPAAMLVSPTTDRLRR